MTTTHNTPTTTTTTTTTPTSTAAGTDLRGLFPDKDSVYIYPDDFLVQDENGNSTPKKDIIFPDLVSREYGHFSDRRIVVMFRPNSSSSYHDINFPVGYWTQVLGLGETPDKVTFTGTRGVYCVPANTDNPNVGSLDTFWRSAENFKSDTTFLFERPGNPKSPQGNNKTPCIPIVQDDEEGSNPIDDVVNSLTQPYKFLYPLYAEDSPFNSESNGGGMLWAVSQAAPIRRVEVTKNLNLSLGANCASGGFVGNLKIGGTLLFGSQQQFCVRNCDVTGGAEGGAWSMVLTGCNSSRPDNPEGMVHWNGSGHKPAVICEANSDDTQTIEKPFLFLDDNNILQLGVPKVRSGENGSCHDAMNANERFVVDNTNTVKVFQPCDSIDDIQKAANNGIHIVLSSGTYNWGKTLIINRDDQVVLGIGMATIQAPGDGRPCIHVRSMVKGVRLSGLALEASVISKFIYKGSCLLQWGDKDRVGHDTGKDFRANPGAIHDLYCFVGGRSLHRTVKVECMVKIYSSYVIGDNLWLWRADHVKLMPKEVPNRPALSEYHVTTYGECKCDTGLEVHGDYVKFNGLAVEHTYKDMVTWYGKHGSVYFYQSELPYDVPGTAYSRDNGSYVVHLGANNHTAKGIGVYSYFRDYDDVNVDSAIIHHALDGCCSTYENVFTVWLNGFSGIKSILNGQGSSTLMPGTSYFLPPSSNNDGKDGERGGGVVMNMNIMNPHFWKGLAKLLFGKK